MINTQRDEIHGNEDMSAEAVIASAIARRGEIFDEFKLLAQESPRTYDLISKTAGYIHHYAGEAGATQTLSGTMRELIAGARSHLLRAAHDRRAHRADRRACDAACGCNFVRDN